MERLFQLIVDFIHLFQFWVVIDAMERGIVYTLGRDGRYIGPRDGTFNTGFHWCAPFNIEMATTSSVQEDWSKLEVQSLITLDQFPVTVQGTFRYKVIPEEAKVRAHQVELGDDETSVPLAFQAAIGAAVTLVKKENLELEAIKEIILSLARKNLNPFGYKVFEFQWIQCSTGRQYRVIT